MKSKITDIFSEFFQNIQNFLAFISTLIVEGAVVAISVLSVLPLADYLVDPTLSSPNYVTQKVLDILKTLVLNQVLLFLDLFLLFKSY